MFVTPEDSSYNNNEYGDSDNNSSQENVRPSSNKIRRLTGLLLILAGLCVLLILPVMHILGTRSQQKLEDQWQEARRGQYKELPDFEDKVKRPGDKQIKPSEKPEQPEQPITNLPKYGKFPPTKILIPKINLDAIVVEGVKPSDLRKGPGHFPKTALPGEGGNCCIAGHRNMYGSWFLRLNHLSKGDRIILATPQAEYEYRVTKLFKVLPTGVHVLDQTPKAMTTLITCTPVPRPTHRLIITAELAERRVSTAKANSSVL